MLRKTGKNIVQLNNNAYIRKYKSRKKTKKNSAETNNEAYVLKCNNKVKRNKRKNTMPLIQTKTDMLCDAIINERKETKDDPTLQSRTRKRDNQRMKRNQRKAIPLSLSRTWKRDNKGTKRNKRKAILPNPSRT